MQARDYQDELICQVSELEDKLRTLKEENEKLKQQVATEMSKNDIDLHKVHEALEARYTEQSSCDKKTIHTLRQENANLKDEISYLRSLNEKHKSETDLLIKYYLRKQQEPVPSAPYPQYPQAAIHGSSIRFPSDPYPQYPQAAIHGSSIRFPSDPYTSFTSSPQTTPLAPYTGAPVYSSQPGFGSTNNVQTNSQPGFGSTNNVQTNSQPGFGSTNNVQTNSQPGFGSTNNVQTNPQPGFGSTNNVQTNPQPGFGSTNGQMDTIQIPTSCGVWTVPKLNYQYASDGNQSHDGWGIPHNADNTELI